MNEDTPNRNRGKHPNDDKLFAPKWLPIFAEALTDVSYLLTRGYGDSSTFELVGNRYKLNKKQRMALARMAASKPDVLARTAKHLSSNKLQNQTIAIDGFNLLILLESALSGAYVFKSQDGCYRDVSSVHGSYKRVSKTKDAIVLVGTVLQELKVAKVEWLLDSPISNSGKLKSMLLDIAATHEFPWEVGLSFNPDKDLAISEHIIVSSDSWILNECKHWFNLGAYLLENHVDGANVFSPTRVE